MEKLKYVLFGLLIIVVCLFGVSFRPYRASVTLTYEAPAGCNLLGELREAISAHHLSARVRPKGVNSFDLVVFDRDRYAAASRVDAAARVLQRTLSRPADRRILLIWAFVTDPPPVHLEKEIFQRIFPFTRVPTTP